MKKGKHVVLITEDDPKLLEAMSEYLGKNGYSVLKTKNGEDALKVFFQSSHEIDIVLLDARLPGISGYTVLETIREYSKVPVMMITSLNSEDNELEGLLHGADKYLTKPVRLRNVKAHMDALLSRIYDLSQELHFGKLCLNLNYHSLTVEGISVMLTPKEFSLLTYFIRNSNQVLSRETILNSIWGYDYEGDIRTVDTLVKQLRKKITDDCPYLHTVYGIGYCFREEAE